MPDINSRLVDCFAVVFPDVPKDRIPAATQDSVKDWDSVAQITLLTVIDEEFGITTDIEATQNLTSFRTILDHIRGSAPNA